MALRWLCVVALVATGCGRFAKPTSGTPPEDTETRLSSSVDVDLAKWLQLPRQDLARLCADQEKAASARLSALREGADKAELLPSLRVPVQALVFQRAEYRASAGVSLPDHVKVGAPDLAAALHLAEHGDAEAALKLADTATRPAVEALRMGRNYPVEWTRLVGLTLADAQIRLATGDHAAAALLVRVHEQLGTLLDEKAKASPLGSVLLGQGRRALQMAARAWRDPARNKVGLAEDVENALAGWGDVPAARFPAHDATRLASVWGKDGKTLAAHGQALERVVDLLALPVPAEALLAVGAFADKDGRLASVQLAYRSGIDRRYPEPGDLGVWMEERGLLAGKGEKSAATSRQTFIRPEWSAEVIRTDRATLLGAVVTLAAARAAPVAGPRGQRAFGPVDFGLPYSVGREALSPLLSGQVLAISDKALVARLAAAIDVPSPNAAGVECRSDADLVSAVRLAWPDELPTADAGRLLAGMWAAHGMAAVEGMATSVKLQWRDGTMVTRLRAPFDGKGTSLTALDNSTEPPASRLKAALQRATRERRERLAAGKPDSRLESGPATINGISAAGLGVGRPREEAEGVLTRIAEKEARKATLPDGESVTILSTPIAGANHWARQVLVRYHAGKVAEVRVRYQEGSAPARKGESLPEKLAGQPRIGPGEPVAPTWAGLWTDVATGQATMRRWQDDLIVRTYQRDAGGSEATWRVRGEDEVRPWRFLVAGVGGISVGDSRSKVQASRGNPVSKVGEADAYRLPAGSPFEMLLVWWEKDTVARLVAVQRGTVGVKPDAVIKALQQAWGRDAAALGFVRRQEPARGQLLGSLFWHDDAIRVRAYVQAEGAGARLLMEWQSWPLRAAPVPAVESAPEPVAEESAG